jgi:MFS transporter, DHA1 family, tetracycline resistance protein
MKNGGSQRTSLMLIAMIVFIDVASIGLVIPVLPSLIGGLAHVSVDRAAEIGGWLLFSFAVMQFSFAPIIGGLSDQYGRRPVLLFTLAALGVDYALMAWAPTLIWLFVGRIISGVMGATWPAANSCIADTATPEERGRAFGLLGGAGASGFVLGPAIGGFFGQFGDRVPFLFACGLCLVGAGVGYFQLKETLPPEKRRAFTLARANPLGNLIQMAKTPMVLGLLTGIFFMQLGSQSQLSVWAYYGIEKFHWTPVEIGLTVTLFGALLAVVQGGLVGPVIARFGEARTASISLLFGIPSYLILAFATHTWHMVVGIFVGTVTGLAFPAMQSLMTARIDEDSQGELQGAIASMISLTSIIGPVLMTGVFGAYADKTGIYFPGAPFILASVLLTVAIGVVWRTLGRYGGVG